MFRPSSSAISAPLGRDLASRLGASALVVALDVLGSLNQTLLTLEALRAYEIPVVGVVFGAPSEPDRTTGTNAGALRRITGLERVSELARVGSVDEAADRLEVVADRLVH